MLDLVDTVNSRRSDLFSELNLPSSSATCTVYVSSFRRRPLMTFPSLVTICTGRLIGHIWLLGSTSDRSSDPALRLAPMSLRSGALRPPVLLMRWHVRQAPLVSTISRPCAGLPGFSDPRSMLFMLRRYATRPVRSAASNLKAGMPAVGKPFV